MSDAAMAAHIYVDQDWEHGLRCAECRHLFVNGERWSERLESFQDEYPIVLIVCEPCGLGGDVQEQETGGEN